MTVGVWAVIAVGISPPTMIAQEIKQQKDFVTNVIKIETIERERTRLFKIHLRECE